ncbi:UMP kinase [Candidatus Woesearchaeota archaeon]|nr:UMP kinase [Candidatus Woesearchaeota archaeon]
MQTIVISLGGSIIVQEKINYKFLNEFKRIILKHKEYKFIIVTGGGKTARTYIEAARKEKLSEEEISFLGILTTRLNANLIADIFNQSRVPETHQEINNIKEKIIVCGALGNKSKMTSDTNAAQIAKDKKAKFFINMTNVPGLFTDDPKTHKNASLIPFITHKDFNNKIQKIKFKAGQHFILDQKASEIIKRNNITTIIIEGNNQLENILNNKKFIGTIIS